MEINTKVTRFVTAPPELGLDGVVLGLDPGSLRTGFSVLRALKARPGHARDFALVDAGVLKADARLAYGQRLALLHDAVLDLIVMHQPRVMVLERAFVAKNAASALKLGEVRGAFMCAAFKHGVTVEEITPAEVKKTIAGNGRADKEQISRALRTLTGFDRGALPYDVTDAMAMSLCYGLRLARRFARGGYAS